MLNYVLKRLLGLIPTLLIVAVLSSLVHLLPGDPARLAAGPEADEATVQLVRQDFGLDKPMHVQFVTFFGNAARRLRSLVAHEATSQPGDLRAFLADVMADAGQYGLVGDFRHGDRHRLGGGAIAGQTGWA